MSGQHTASVGTITIYYQFGNIQFPISIILIIDYLLLLLLLFTISITLWLFNIAMENGPFIDDFPIKIPIYKGFSMAMLNNQMVIVYRVIGVMIPILTYSVKIVS